MFVFDLKNKLQQIDGRLYVKDDAMRYARGEALSAVYLKENRRGIRSISDTALHYASAEAREHLEDVEYGFIDTFVCGIPLGEIPEYDQFDVIDNRIVCAGWRTVALKLVEKKICSLEKARKVFECSSLGEADIDKMSFCQKLELARRKSNANCS